MKTYLHCFGWLVLVAVATSPIRAEEMIRVEPGTFQMGSPDPEVGRYPDEVLHEVEITRPFFLGSREVSWRLWFRVRAWAVKHGYAELSPGQNGFNGGENENHPVIGVTWWDAIQWCNARSEMEGLTPVYYRDRGFSDQNVIRGTAQRVLVNRHADGYRLPTEAEWEYACRAGTHSAYAIQATNVEDGAAWGWHSLNSERNTRPGASKPANDWGFYDMHGNAWEWCWDWYGAYAGNRVEDPAGPADGGARVLRGGSWMNPPDHARSAYRHALAPSTFFYTLGFRVAQNGK